MKIVPWIRFITVVTNLLERLIFNRRLAKKLKLIIKERNLNLNKTVTIVDCGANKGQTAIFYSKLFPNHFIHCLEANPEVIRKLTQKTKSVNNKIYNLGVSDKDGFADLNVCIFEEVSTLKLPDKKSKYLNIKSVVLLSRPKNLYKQITIKTKKLDTLYFEKEITNIDILKIDVEGHEYSLLKGAHKTIKDLKPAVIQIEVHHDDQYANQSDSVISLLSDYGYIAHSRVRHSHGNFYDYLFVIK